MVVMMIMMMMIMAMMKTATWIMPWMEMVVASLMMTGDCGRNDGDYNHDNYLDGVMMSDGDDDDNDDDIMWYLCRYTYQSHHHIDRISLVWVYPC